MSACWLNGKLVAKEQACVSVYDHGLLYGDGVFEGIRFYNGCAFLLQQHLDRLYRSAAALLLEIPYTVDQLTRGIYETIAAHGEPDGYLRLVVTRGAGELGIDPAHCAAANTFIIADQLRMVARSAATHGIRAIIVSTRRVPNASWDARIKSLNYLNNVLARLEARNANADEAIMLNQTGNIAEGALNNVFIVRDGVLLTPPATDGALAGITREVILQLAKTQNIPAEERSLTPYDLYTARECFLTGTGVELVPVREVDGRKLGACPGGVFSKLQTCFEAFVRDETTCNSMIVMENR